MKYFEKVQLPHAVYRFFRDDETLLYVGCSLHPITRLEVHANMQPWYREIARIEIKWFPNYLDAARAEQTAIGEEEPRYNKLVFPPERVGAATLRHAATVMRHDGFTCPRCGGPKEHKPGKAYCQACYAEYRIERARAAGVKPKPPPTVTCPRCGGVKEVGLAYCRPCKTSGR